MTRKLHIGGCEKAEGWEILNANPAPNVDHVGNANDLSKFPNCTFSEMYASHIVEHLDYKDELEPTLKEWLRVMKPGGKIYISVPDLDVLAGLIISKDNLTLDERFHVMRMLFGGHVDKYDYHVVGLNEAFLTKFLERAGYVNIKKVDNFGLFNDTSSMVFKDVAISLNLVAEKSISDFPASNTKPTVKKVGRNDLCPCGSGKKYKKCHGKSS
jgi:predicted SAM-dependent methyltransferase